MNFKPAKGALKGHLLYILDNFESTAAGLTPAELRFARASAEKGDSLLSINRYDAHLFFCVVKDKPAEYLRAEALRKTGAELQGILTKQKIADLTIINESAVPDAAFHVAQGLALADYQFLRYRSDRDKKTSPIRSISFAKGTLAARDIEVLQTLTEAAYRARTLVNEPVNFLTAAQLGKEIANMGKEAGFSVRVMGLAAIEKEGMGGILAVNRGSVDPPTFTVMEYKPAGKVRNKKPIVLVGKGIVYDTGGLSLKPTAASMDRMKSDMSGAALVTAAMYAIAQLRLPLHVYALVPATDNRPGGNAYTPGDVITQYSGATVEVLNTDAEGRLVLADALHWAKRYNPELVLDFATLTGAASVAVGEHGIVCMGTASEEVKAALRESGNRQYERLVEYPLWDEYGEQIKSEIADLKNVGGPSGGAITAGKFLQHFTDYPWMHFDIAGVSFATSKKGYIPFGGTAYGFRMVMDFLINYNS